MISQIGVLHVGNTPSGKKGLNQKLYNHISNTSSLSKGYLLSNGIALREGCEFKFLEVENLRMRAFLQAYSIGMLCPAHIGTGEKAVGKTNQNND
jgi:hypothetical protein